MSLRLVNNGLPSKEVTLGDWAESHHTRPLQAEQEAGGLPATAVDSANSRSEPSGFLPEPWPYDSETLTAHGAGPSELPVRPSSSWFVTGTQS